MIYWYIVLIIVKHFLADVYFQTGEMSNGKRLSGLAGIGWRMAHAFQHGAGTFLVVGITGAPLLSCIGFGLVDFTLHYIIDFIKILLEVLYIVIPKSRAWYILMCTDQVAHFTCYIVYGIILFG